MGGNTSDTLTLSDEIWNRDIEKMFTSSKMTEQFNFKAKFLQAIKYNSDKGEVGNYVFISDTGTITCLSNILPDIEFTQELGSIQIKNVFNIGSSRLVAFSDDKIYILEYQTSKFNVITLDIAKPQFFIPLNDKIFVIVTKNGEIHLVGEDNKNQLILKVEINSSIIQASCMNLDQQYILISTEATSYIISIINNPNCKDLATFANAEKVICDDREIYLAKKGSNIIYKVTARPDFTFSDPEPITPQTNENIIDFVLLSKKLLLIIYQNTILSYMAGTLSRQIVLPSTFSPKICFPLARIGYFILICKGGHILLCKLSDSSNPADKNEKKFIELSWLHKCEISQIVSIQESSFLTFDENGIAILWENLPNWWNAPHFLDMFGEKENSALQK